ncbi:hypothetical protein KSF73_16970 [Burkholderiaceae bacterium DAT-1]|nr:hypothetical protein [Burkholderiaceae bacterium DAT-1]
MTAQDYLARAQLQHAVSIEPIEALARRLQTVRDQAQFTDSPETLYQYHVPMLGEGGACSLFDELDPTPYNLADTLDGITDSTTRALTQLRALVAEVASSTQCDWLGIYAKRTLKDGSRALVKLAYHGKPSRAEFPLTAEFAEHSNNSSVGLSGQGKIIDDVAGWVADGGAYYTCDPDVRSEACLPLFDDRGILCGIIDAEDARAGFFSGQVLETLIALCLVAPSTLP